MMMSFANKHCRTRLAWELVGVQSKLEANLFQPRTVQSQVDWATSFCKLPTSVACSLLMLQPHVVPDGVGSEGSVESLQGRLGKSAEYFKASRDEARTGTKLLVDVST